MSVEDRHDVSHKALVRFMLQRALMYTQATPRVSTVPCLGCVKGVLLFQHVVQPSIPGHREGRGP